MNSNLVITIARQCGSGGREIGEKLAEKLGIKFVDNELITMAAKKSGMSQKILSEADEKATNSLLYTLAMGSSFYGGNVGIPFDLPINDKLFVTQSEIIRTLADESDAVFIGRCSDNVLQGYPNLIRLFIYAPINFRTAELYRRHGLTLDKSKDTVIKTDKRRSNYYNYYTGRKWGQPDNYDLMVDSSRLGVDLTVEMLTRYIDVYRNRNA